MKNTGNWMNTQLDLLIITLYKFNSCPKIMNLSSWLGDQKMSTFDPLIFDATYKVYHSLIKAKLVLSL